MYNHLMELAQSLKRLEHHAYLLVGREETKDRLLSVLEQKHRVNLRGNPDLIVKDYDNLTIDDSRELKSLAEIKPVSRDGRRIFVVSVRGFTVEAQNALLKVFEEPGESVCFFLIVPSASLFLPTVRSRLRVIDQVRAPETDQVEIKKFLGLSLADRLGFVKDLLDDISKEKKTKQDALDFLDGLQSSIYASRGVRSGSKVFRSIETARKYLNDRSPSLKMLLEYVVLSL